MARPKKNNSNKNIREYRVRKQPPPRPPTPAKVKEMDKGKMVELLKAEAATAVPTYLGMAVGAIMALKDRTGSSRQVVDLGPRFFKTPIWDPDLGPDLGSRFGTPIWDPDLGPRFGTPNTALTTVMY
jgi:hypothetical protein